MYQLGVGADPLRATLGVVARYKSKSGSCGPANDASAQIRFGLFMFGDIGARSVEPCQGTDSSQHTYMAPLRVLFVALLLTLAPTLSATAAPKKRTPQATPTPTSAPVLRVENLSLVQSLSSSRNIHASISVRVMNRSGGEARDVSAYVVFKNGFAVALRGQKRIPPFGRAVLSGSARLPAALMVRPQVILSCAGCRRYG